MPIFLPRDELSKRFALAEAAAHLGTGRGGPQSSPPEGVLSYGLVAREYCFPPSVGRVLAVLNPSLL